MTRELKPLQHKPIREGTSPAVRALIERLRASGDRADKIVMDAQKLWKGANLDGIGAKVFETMLELNRKEVKAVDDFGGEVTAEDTLLEEQEARWAEEDKQGTK